MICSSPAARGQSIMKIRPNIRYTVIPRNYNGDGTFSPIKSFMLIQCFDKQWNSNIWKVDIWVDAPEKENCLDYSALPTCEGGEKVCFILLAKEEQTLIVQKYHP